jgi:hypothetical protein
MPALASIRRFAPHAIALFNSAIFLDSLRYKFTDHPNTQVIFGKLNAWTESLGIPGLFGHGGLFSQYVIGTGELAASSLLLLGVFAPRYRFLQPVGAGLGLAIMTGAITFHLFTPLGVDPNHDGGGLFAAACVVWFGSAALLALRYDYVKDLAHRAMQFLTPAPMAPMKQTAIGAPRQA